MIKISIIMPVYNGKLYICEAIDSILNQKINSNIQMELIIVDDGSNDSTENIIKTYKKRIDWIKFIKIPHSGKVFAINVGYKYSTGNIISLFAHDDVLFSKSIQKRLEEIEKGADFVYHNSFVADDKLNISHILYGKKYNPLCLGNNNFYRILKSNIVGGGLVCFSKGLSKKIFPIPNELRFEDWWIMFLASIYAKKIVYIPEPLSIYRIHENNDNGLLELNLETIKRDYRRHDKYYERFIQYIINNKGLLLSKNIDVDKAIDICIFWRKLKKKICCNEFYFPFLWDLKYFSSWKNQIFFTLYSKDIVFFRILRILYENCIFRKDPDTSSNH